MENSSNMGSFVPQQKVPLAPLTTLQVGGEAEYFASIDNEEQLLQACKWAKEYKQPVTIFSGGSNVLVSDAGLEGLVLQINTKGRKYQTNPSGSVMAAFQAGEILDEAISETVARGLWGLENLSGIPGSVGATPVQNVGAYGVEVADIIYSLRIFDTENFLIQDWLASECEFAYRDSIFKKNKGRYIILAVTFSLQTEFTPHLAYKDLQDLQKSTNLSQKKIREKVIAIRKGKFPDWRTIGTAGSFFKNPIVEESEIKRLLDEYPEMPFHKTVDGLYKLPLGWILDHVCNLRGYTKEAVGLYVRQALVLVNYGDASAGDILEFANEIKESVFSHTGLKIEFEVTQLPPFL